MKIGFIDFIDWDYNADTPYNKPLGGGQSAFAYLSAALAVRGHEVHLLTHTTRPGPFRGVQCVSLEGLYEEDLKELGFDAIIVLNAAEALDLCLRIVGTSTPLILWAQHASDQPAMKSLGTPEARLGWNGVACCSEFHRRQFIQDFGLDEDRTVNLGNAIGPAFESLFAPDEAITPHKSEPILAYTSTPFRGLAYLLKAFPEIRARVPGTRLKVFSSMSVYNMGGAEDPYGDLYKQCQVMDGVEYVGSVAQPVLAREMKSVRVLAYPNTFAEMQCISVMEAMAAGAHVVTSDFAALPETCAGFADLIPMSEPREYLARFADTVVKALKQPPPERILKLRRQFFVDRHSWSRRALAWEDWLKG